MIVLKQKKECVDYEGFFYCWCLFDQVFSVFEQRDTINHCRVQIYILSRSAYYFAFEV